MRHNWGVCEQGGYNMWVHTELSYPNGSAQHTAVPTNIQHLNNTTYVVVTYHFACPFSVHQASQHTPIMMEAVTERTGEVDEHQARQVEISNLLKQRAPLMCPSVVPRALKEALAGVQAFLSSDAGKVSASAASSSTATDRSEEGKEDEEDEEVVGDDGGRHVVLTTETDIATRTFRITAAKVRGRTRLILGTIRECQILSLALLFLSRGRITAGSRHT